MPDVPRTNVPICTPRPCTNNNNTDTEHRRCDRRCDAIDDLPTTRSTMYGACNGAVRQQAEDKNKKIYMYKI